MTSMTATSGGPNIQRSHRLDPLLHDLVWSFSVAPDLQPTLSTNGVRLIAPRTNATYGGTAHAQRMPVAGGNTQHLLERIVRVWALEEDETGHLTIISNGNAAMASNLATATDLLVHYLKQDRIAGVVRRPVPAIGGATLLDLLLKGNSEKILEVCQDMFRFDDVYA